MERYKKGGDRNQLSLLPMSLDDMIPECAEVRALEVIIDKMDIRSLGFTNCVTKSTGRMPYDPVDMFKLYAYSYFNGIRSSRKIERECARNIELMWLIGGLKPDFKTIADFRKDNKNQIKAAFLKFTMICSGLGLTGKEIIAVDGSKFRASNSRLRYHTEKKVDKKIEYHSQCAEQYIALLDACDNEEHDNPKYTKAELIDKIDRINNRIEQTEEDIKEKGTIYETDSGARMMHTNNYGADICHNVQIAVDDKNHMVVAVDVTSQTVDKEQLYNIASQAKDNLEVEALTVIADKGYYSAYQFAQCEDEDITPIVSKADRSFMAVTEAYSKEAFKYDEDRTGYVCPQGHFLKPYRMRETSKFAGHIRYVNKEACMNCKVRHLCTNGETRTINDRPYEEYARMVDERTREREEVYQQRKQLAEHPFGTVKRGFGFSYFLTRGTESVRAESCLHFLVYNMKRAINIMGTSGLRVALQG